MDRSGIRDFDNRKNPIICLTITAIIWIIFVALHTRYTLSVPDTKTAVFQYYSIDLL